MAEPKVAALRAADDPRPVVVHAYFVHAVFVGKYGTVEQLRLKETGSALARKSVPGLDMRLDRALGGVAISFPVADKMCRLLVPMANVSFLELE